MSGTPRSNRFSMLIASLITANSGNVAITFAIATLPLVLAVGATLDFTASNKAKSKLDAMADAAALSTVNKNALNQTANSAKQNAVNFFNAQASTVREATVTSTTATVTDGTNGRSTVFSYTADVPTNFMGIAGYNKVTLKGSSTAVSAEPVYADFYLLLDNTPSMGIGATPADVTALQNRIGCAFACHDMSTSPNDGYAIAKSMGVKTRLDTVRIAAQSLTDTARDTQTVSGQIRMAIYSFGTKAQSPGLTAVAPLSSDLTQVKANAGALDLMSIPYNGYNNDQITDFDKVFSDVNAALPNPGDGKSSASPQKYLFFVSDGLADAYYPSTCQGISVGGGRCQEPIKTKNCDVIKNRGIKIAVLYTTYQPLDNGWYIDTVAPMNAGPWGPSPNSRLAQNMQACASPGLYFEVSPTQGISEAMKALFLQIAKFAHLSK